MPSTAPDAAPPVGATAELTIDSLSHRGEGVGRLNGCVCFVPGALPGETVGVRIVQRSRHHCHGDLQTLVRASDQRQRPPCILADHCGGCSLQHCTDAAEAQWKQQRVQEVLQRIGRLHAVPSPIEAGERTLHYRNRAVIPLRRGDDGRLRAGYYRRGSHRIVNMNQCPVLDPRLDALIAPLKRDLDASDWPADSDVADCKGLRHLALRVGHYTGEVLITLISSTGELPGLEVLAHRWQERWPEVVGVTLNLQPKPNNVVMGETTLGIAGRSWIEESLAGLKLRIASDTFFQVNTPQAERVVPFLLQALGGASTGRLVDAYCGIGTYSLPIAQHGWQVVGLERSGASVDLARLNATCNGLAERCQFQAVDVAAALQEHLVGCDALLLDPPRKGLDATTQQVILDNPPTTVLYLSCDPATLARDLQVLVSTGGYRLEALQPFDFFPQTSHVESLAVLRR